MLYVGFLELFNISLKCHFTVYNILEDDPRSTPGRSKDFDQIRAIMKLMIVVSSYSRFDKKVA